MSLEKTYILGFRPRQKQTRPYNSIVKKLVIGLTFRIFNLVRSLIVSLQVSAADLHFFLSHMQKSGVCTTLAQMLCEVDSCS